LTVRAVDLSCAGPPGGPATPSAAADAVAWTRPDGSRPTVLVADDHPSTRLGVQLSLERGGFEVVAEAGDAWSAVRAALRERPDVCVLDVHMPGGGIEAAAAITRGLPTTRVVMLTVSDDEDHVFASLRAGAVGYLLKDTPPERFPAALHGVLRGEAALPRALMGKVVGQFRMLAARPAAGPADGPGDLSAREWEILVLLRDMSTAEVAARLALSPVTVRRHISSAVSKLGVSDRREAVRFVERLAS
jgi:DNA-binding NarL/FixJ family response regulator